MEKSAYEERSRYQQMVTARTPKPKYAKNIALAYLVGGAICTLAQAVFNAFSGMSLTKLEVSAATLATIIALGAVVTGLGVYDCLAERGGMGAAVPISGFSNTITAAAMDFKREGYLLGMGAKMFVIAGPVIVYGLVGGFVVTLIRLAFAGISG
ncbi:MAG: SpoVA/SpoVAEb family sporulation membrane protein [Firmicutes bacterium]|nr:SpoVA/SpoVAEb family sporulation membrane protein [Bacillota bacterium]